MSFDNKVWNPIISVEEWSKNEYDDEDEEE